METLAIAEAFDVFNESLRDLLPSPIPLVENPFLLQGAEEISTAALSQHAPLRFMLQRILWVYNSRPIRSGCTRTTTAVPADRTNPDPKPQISPPADRVRPTMLGIIPATGPSVHNTLGR
jgi:hypothetical protein